MAKIKLPKKLKCQKCLYEWTPRQTDVRICPKCKTAKWDVKRIITDLFTEKPARRE